MANYYTNKQEAAKWFSLNVRERYRQHGPVREGLLQKDMLELFGFGNRSYKALVEVFVQAGMIERINDEEGKPALMWVSDK